MKARLLLLCLLVRVHGHTKYLVEIKLSLRPDLDLRVKGIPLVNTSIEESGGRYAIAIGNSYLSANDELAIGPDEFYWDIYDRPLGTVVSYEDRCLTYTGSGLEALPCIDPSDFGSAAQLFQMEKIVGSPGRSDEIYRRLDLVGKVDRLVRPLRVRMAQLADSMEPFCSDSQSREDDRQPLSLSSSRSSQ